jgi:hypothetical protein
MGPVKATEGVPLSFSVGKWPGREFESRLNRPDDECMGPYSYSFICLQGVTRGITFTHTYKHTQCGSWARAAAWISSLLGSHSGHTPVTPPTSN